MSRFVPGGTVDQPVERDEEWSKAQQELEEERREKADAGQQNSGKSLYEVLQENKAAKQEAFQESIRLKNQFRTLDEDEIEFLDSVLESTRAQEAAVTKETMEQLELFHRQREEAAKAEAANANPQELISPEEQNWTTVHRKRRRKEKEPLPGAKLRKRSTDQKPPTVDEAKKGKEKAPSAPPDDDEPKKIKTLELSKDQAGSPEVAGKATSPSPERAVAHPTAGLGLDAYSSDED
ncbi:hypothetical protein KEM56_007216 [Ascosphaera pollenicola]|nr:hypothetical protein KEM56_007216 [Ascosphaera pollenicola]